MRKLCIFVGMTIGSYVGWAIPDYFGWSFFACFIISGLVSVAGVWAGWKIAMKLEE